MKNVGDLDLLYTIIEFILLEINDLKNRQSFPVFFCRNFIIAVQIIVGSYVNFSGKVREVRSIFFVRLKCV